MNTILIVEPRQLPLFDEIIMECLGGFLNKWKIVFYCGKSAKSYWENLIDKKFNIEYRELHVDNFENSNLYNDFLKQKSLWETLYGEYVLTFQADCWIINKPPYTIDFFLNLNKSYIGGNMRYQWNELLIDNILFEKRNFNGGLSLRKRIDMIKIIETYPPQKTTYNSTNIYTDAEDVFFTIGCVKLNLPVGNDDVSSHFAIHTIYKQEYFSLHQPSSIFQKEIYANYPELIYKTPYLYK
jgi:hypothetical protein